MATTLTTNVTIPNGGYLSSTGTTYTLNTGATTGTISSLSGATVGGVTLSGSTYSTSWATPSTNFSNGNGKSLMTIPHGEDKLVLEEKATLEVKGTVKINGIDLEERLKTIERVLAIPERDVTMEAKYPSLKKKFDEYINALEKYRTFERIKGDE